MPTHYNSLFCWAVENIDAKPADVATLDEGTEERVGRAWREGREKIYRSEDSETPFSKGRAFAITDKRLHEEGDTVSPKALKRETELLHTGIYYYPIEKCFEKISGTRINFYRTRKNIALQKLFS